MSVVKKIAALFLWGSDLSFVLFLINLPNLINLPYIKYLAIPLIGFVLVIFWMGYEVWEDEW